MPLATSTSAQQLRPLTLAGPEREPVQFTVNLVGAPAEVEQLVQQIKTVAEQFLYHWKTFPIGKLYKRTIKFYIKTWNRLKSGLYTRL